MVCWLDEAAVLECITPDLVIGAVEQAFRALARQRAINIPRERVRLPTGVAQHILQGALLDEGVMGYKAYTSSRYGNRFAVFLFDAKTGALGAILEANALGQWRTGAASAVATRALAASEPSVIGLLGAGWQAAGQVRLLHHMYPNAEFRVFSRKMEACAVWCEAQQKELRAAITVVESAEAAFSEADVCITATTSVTPVFQADWIKAGGHINAVGANALNRCEVPEALMRKAVCVVDQRETAQRECGDLLALVEKGHRNWSLLTELGEVLEGLRPARTEADQVTVFESQGLGILDIAVAHAVCEVARAKGLGGQPPNHFLEGSM